MKHHVTKNIGAYFLGKKAPAGISRGRECGGPNISPVHGKRQCALPSREIPDLGRVVHRRRRAQEPLDENAAHSVTAAKGESTVRPISHLGRSRLQARAREEEAHSVAAAKGESTERPWSGQ